MEGKSVEEYLEILYPENKDNQETLYFEKEYDKKFIEENIDEINKFYRRFIENKELYGEEWQQLADIELMRKALDEAKARYYYGVLNPERDFEGEHLTYDNLTEDIDFIYTHLYEIEKEYLGLLKDKEENYKSWSDDELLGLALKTTKGNNYFDLLYPEYEETEKTSEYLLTTSKDLEFIFDNLEEIDREYRKIIHEKIGNEEEISKLTKIETMRTVINMVKSRIISESEMQPIQEETSGEEVVPKNRPEEGIEELLNNIEIESDIKGVDSASEEQVIGNDEFNVDDGKGATEYDIEIIPTKEVAKEVAKEVVTSKEIANLDMINEIPSSLMERIQRFIDQMKERMETLSARLSGR